MAQTLGHHTDPRSTQTIALTQVSEEHLPQTRQSLRDEVLAIITAALEEQRKVNGSWADRFDVVAESVSALLRSEDAGEDFQQR